ncbi:adenosylcobinamide-GDP ribazoletransferase [Rhizobium sp. SSA_523]|uniref:adenosylcobinamide-GDP ribazoletransferase n=1 Tax=Rhizobium sp. SSA_523 TaxID=2952477 RepID=UPI00209175B1|nr:adenosylcobinamide-GDP ribazoletransferase [Rhizobium sp. SSA_523]MCO5730040.1 adenosylcobinamide-GDP ribazoletransferase [Rhizobium sp. SSA_523]WKC25108.1 adenosylcobinamide-GDP ribazoletransferase [Rhizobium sp. SSA_523]
MTDLARSLGFLSRLPVPARFFVGFDGSMRHTARAFGLAGLVIGALPALLLALLGQAPAGLWLAALLALAAGTLLTGALHEDGLADTADGLLGGRDRQQALAIMKDSRIGAFGTIALILSFGLRAAALSALLSLSGAASAAMALLAAASLSRALMVWHWHSLPPARPDGTAASLGQPDRAARNLALLPALALALLLPLLPGAALGQVLLALIVTIGCAKLFEARVRSGLNGHTGDTIGATQQITETAFLCTLAAMA